jgi:hypothetical protein
MDTDLQDRVAALETRSSRFRLASEGADGFHNYFTALLLEERDYVESLLTHVIANLHRDILSEVKAMLDAALTRRIRGTFSEKETYAANDVVACNGASFVAKCNNPGSCPSSGNWQMVAAQGRRGAVGPRGERGEAAPKLEKWIVDRSTLTATPVYSGGIFGPTLDLSELFSQSPSETT